MGEVTNIKHVIAPPLGQYPRGDLVFDIGTVIHGVDKGWPMTVIETDRNDFPARFGIPRRLSDDGYHAYLALYNHESTVGHYVRVVDNAARYPYLAFNSNVNEWSGTTSYSEGSAVYLNGVIYQALQDNTNQNPPANASFWSETRNYTRDLYTGTRNFENGWAGETTSYNVGDIVQYNDSKYVCMADVAADASNTDPAADTTNWDVYTDGQWNAYVSYKVEDIAEHNGSKYVCMADVAADASNTDPAADTTNWDVYTDGQWNSNITYATGDVVENGDLYVSLSDSNTNAEPGAVDDWVVYNPVFQRDSSFGDEVSVGGDMFMVAILKNGVTVDNKYGVAISGLNRIKETFQVAVYENINGENKIVEGPFTVGLTPGTTKADGSPLFIEAVFEQSSQIVKFEVDEENTDISMIAEEPICWFSGGDPGGAPSDEDYEKAWDLLKKAEVDQLFMAGDTNTNHIQEALEVAKKKQIRLEADAIGGTPEAASEWVKDNMGIFQSHLLSLTYGRVSFKDPFYSGSRKNLGMSGFATAAKAYGREASKTMIDAGVEEVPAGERFGLLRGVAGIRNETSLSEDDQKDLAENWVNYTLNSTKAGIIFWEQFTCYGDESPLAYKRIVDVMNYVYKIHREIMQENQFRGKSDQQIIDLLSPPLRRLQTKGVLIPDPTGESEFPEPFQIWITTAGNKRQIHRMMRISRAIGPIILETILA